MTAPKHGKGRPVLYSMIERENVERVERIIAERDTIIAGEAGDIRIPAPIYATRIA